MLIVTFITAIFVIALYTFDLYVKLDHFEYKLKQLNSSLDMLTQEVLDMLIQEVKEDKE